MSSVRRLFEMPRKRGTAVPSDGPTEEVVAYYIDEDGDRRGEFEPVRPGLSLEDWAEMEVTSAEGRWLQSSGDDLDPSIEILESFDFEPYSHQRYDAYIWRLRIPRGTPELYIVGVVGVGWGVASYRHHPDDNETHVECRISRITRTGNRRSGRSEGHLIEMPRKPSTMDVMWSQFPGAAETLGPALEASNISMVAADAIPAVTSRGILYVIVPPDKTYLPEDIKAMLWDDDRWVESPYDDPESIDDFWVLR